MTDEHQHSAGFAISADPVLEPDAMDDAVAAEAQPDELSRRRGERRLFVIPRDPHTLFAYWTVDWDAVFAEAAPHSKQVHLRVSSAAEVESRLINVEPLASGAYVEVSQPATSYSLELGYFAGPNEWKAVATAPAVITPGDSVADSDEYELVTVPLHLEFQQMVDMLRGPRFDAAALIQTIANLQKRAESSSDSLHPDDRAFVRQLNDAAVPLAAANQSEPPPTPAMVRAQFQRILGAGLNPPTSFGGGGS